MRSVSPAQRDAYGSTVRATWLRAFATDADGVERELSDLIAGLDVLDAVVLGETLDNPVGTATVTLRREADVAGVRRSIVPLMSAAGSGGINVNAAAGYAPFLDVGLIRALRVESAVTAGTETTPPPAPAAGDWREAFTGVVDRISFGGGWDMSVATLTCRDIGARLLDADVQTAAVIGAGPSSPVETVLQSVINLAPNPPTVYVVGSPAWNIAPYTPPLDKVLTDARALALQIGWDLRYRYDATDTFRLTFSSPDRSGATVLATFGPGEYRAIPVAELDSADVRNYWRGFYFSGGIRQTPRNAWDQSSRDKYGDYFASIAEDAASNIQSAAEMDRLLAAAVADTAFPWLTAEIEVDYYPVAQIGDVYTFQGPCAQWDTDQTLAVVSITHTFQNGTAVTRLGVRGKPSAGYWTWINATTQARLAAAGPVAPDYTEDRSFNTDRTVGTLTVGVRSDVQARVTSCTFTLTDGKGATSTLTIPAGPGAPPFEGSVAINSTKNPSTIAYEVFGTDAFGNAGASLRKAVVPFAVGGVPVLEEIKFGISSAGVVSSYSTGDSDTWRAKHYLFTGLTAPDFATIDAAGLSDTAPGSRFASVANLGAVRVGQRFTIGVVLYNANGTASQVYQRSDTWGGVGVLPKATVSVGAPVVQGDRVTWPITFDQITNDLYIYKLEDDHDRGAVRVDDLVGREAISYVTGQNGVAPGVTIFVTLRLRVASNWQYMTPVPYDYQNQPGVVTGYRVQGPGTTPPAAPSKPTVPGTVSAHTATSLATPVTDTNTGAAIAAVRIYDNGGAVAGDVAWTAGGGGTQTITLGGLSPATAHSLQYAGVTAGGVVGPLSDVVTGTTDAAATGGTGGTGTNGRVPAANLLGASWSQPDQAAILSVRPAGGTPAGTTWRVFLSSVGAAGPSDEDTGAQVTLDPSISPTAPVTLKSAMDQGMASVTRWYYVIGSNPAAGYADGLPSNVRSATMPGGYAS